MKTADLIARLARDAAPVRPAAVLRRLGPPTMIGVAIAAVAVVVWLGVRPLGEAMGAFAFWMKGGYTSLLAVAGALLVVRLARPGGTLGAGRWIALATFAAMLGLAVAEYLAVAPEAREAAWLGGSWSHCPFRILALSVPIYVGLLIGLRRLAPTRLALAGGAAGFFAGAAGATVYQIFCPETGAMFVATWYTLGVAASTALGALVGRRLLRW